MSEEVALVERPPFRATASRCICRCRYAASRRESCRREQCAISSRLPPPLDHHDRARHVAAGRGQGAARPFPITGARLDQTPQGLDGFGALSLNDLLVLGAIAGEADRIPGTAVRTGASASSPPDATAGDAGSEVAVPPVSLPASQGAACPLPRTPSRVYASLRGHRSQPSETCPEGGLPALVVRCTFERA